MILVEEVEHKGVDEPLVLSEKLQTAVHLSPETCHCVFVTENHCATVGGGLDPKQNLLSLFL